MNGHILLLLLLMLALSGSTLAFSTWRFRRRNAAQQRQLSNLYAVAEDMIAAAEPAEIYRCIVRTLPAMLDATHGYLFLQNRVTKQLDVLAGTDQFPAAGCSMDVVSGPVTCFRNKALLEVPDAENCPFLDHSVVEQLRQKSVLFVPLISEGETFGVLEIDDRRRKRSFTEEQKASAQHVANLGALAMRLCEQRSMREQLYRTEKMAAVGELISGVAHELKNPLASLSGLSELALARYGSGPLAQDLRAIHAEARHANTILQRLISFARPQKSGPVLVDINAVLRSVVAIRAEKWESQGIRVHVQLSTTPPIVASDQSHLEQVFLNLLINAERALEGSREKVITVRTTIAAKRVLIHISDTGPLFSADLQSRVYHPFFDARKPIETAGLGLALCQSLIEGHGGSIRVSNSPNHATTFEIEYPLADSLPPKPAQVPAARKTESRPPATLTALVIDEDRKVQDSLLSLLSDRQYRVITVSSAEEALDLAERARFDLVLCDVRMRGISGIELYRRLQSRIQSFVFLTADTFSTDIREMFSEPNQAVLAKPFTAADVERLLDEIEPRMTGVHAG
ncbi:MAG TPA: ATP-binding protein [Bryobacterales bacterium]|jgi:signal transduction histidine kinase|nr:ATP-binding protein [Bryobacterales bacterium]